MGCDCEITPHTEKPLFYADCGLFEVSVKKSLKTSAMSCLVARHLVNGVVDGVEVMAKPY